MKKKLAVLLTVCLGLMSLLGCMKNDASSPEERLKALSMKLGTIESEAERRALVEAELSELEKKNLINSDVSYDERNGIFSFTYKDGTLGGIMIRAMEEVEN